MNTLEYSTRRIELQGCYNLRDLGGYLTTDDQQTCWRMILRADGLHRLPPSSQQSLLDYGIRTIIDLRHVLEVKKSPNVFARSSSLTYLNIPLIEDPDDEWVPPTLVELNLKMLDQCQQQIKQVFEILAGPDTFPALFHCTGGKDRTGLIAALLLSLLQVPDATVAEDYALSTHYLGPLLEQFRATAQAAGQNMDRFERLMQTRPEDMLTVLSILKVQYGGAKAYLEALGLTDAQLISLQERLTEPRKR